MNVRSIINSLIVSTFFLESLMTISCIREKEPPNIVLILCDDMGFSDLGCYGGEIHTPNIDRLAQNGIRMTRAYNSARCCPSRASLFTGLYPHQTGIGYMTEYVQKISSNVEPGYVGFLQDRCVGIPEVLKSKGYKSYMSGKWHMGGSPGPIEKGFDEYYGNLHGGHVDCWDSEDMHRLPEGRPVINYAPGTFYSTDAITDYALDFIEEDLNESKPFFLYLAFNAPHYPLQAPKELTDKYFPLYMQGWDSIREKRFEKIMNLRIGEPDWKLPPRSEVMIEMRGRDMGYGGESNPGWDTFPEDRKKDLARRMSVYAAMIEKIDQNIGRVIKRLEKSGEIENTLIIFLSDNGANAEVNPLGFDAYEPKDNILNTGSKLDSMGLPGSFIGYGSGWAMASNTPLNLYKHYTHEGGISTPFIIHWPDGIKNPGTIDKRPAHITDVMATCVEVSGAEYPLTNKGFSILPMEGISLVPVMKGELSQPRTLGFEHEGNRAYLKGEWKIVSAHYREGVWELYNIERDRLEQNNLASQYPEKVEELSKEYHKWAERVMVYPKKDWNFKYLKKYKEFKIEIKDAI
jgi:arylsulfatase A-like enzyme